MFQSRKVRRIVCEVALVVGMANLGSVSPAQSDDAGASSPVTFGTVTLPLGDYEKLVERVERVEEARRQPIEPAISELTAQAMAVTVRDEVAEIRSTYQVEIRGEPISPVPLPLSGLPESATVEPLGSASLHRRANVLMLVATQPGSYTVTVNGRATLAHDAGTWRLPLAATRAPVVTLSLDLPADLKWDCAGAVKVEERTSLGRRQLQLAPQSGQRPILQLRREVIGVEQERARARAVVVTVARVGGAGIERRDIVLYEVERGALGRFVLDLPAGLEVARASTDEGTIAPVVESGRLVVERQHELASTGDLAVTYRPASLSVDGEVPLAPIWPTIPVRSRYLVLAFDQVADAPPLPAAAWSRVDVEDFPLSLRPMASALGPKTLWRRTAESATPGALPPARLSVELEVKAKR